MYPCTWDGCPGYSTTMCFDFLSNLPDYLLIGAFSPFTSKVNIVMCEFDPAILMLAGYLAHWLIHSVIMSMIFIMSMFFTN